VITNDVYNTEMLPSPSQSRIRRTIPSMPNLEPIPKIDRMTNPF
jgi:hypothetical protein